MKFLFVIAILFYILNVTAQDLKYIPDLNLKTELIRLGFTTNDSLDIRKINGYLQLNCRVKFINQKLQITFV